jgi:phage gp16-like protein
MSSTIRTHSNTLSLEDRIKYQQAVDRKAQKLMPSTDDEIKQTSADTAKVLSHESKEAATQNPYTEFTEKFRSWFDGNVSK